jgi:NAD(P)-dependent dehydrogenase (short-subunit alcohol dehydrogenase family)
MRLDGKVAIVTGSARHIGALYAQRLAADGASVAVADILDGDPVVREIAARGGKAVALKVDVSSEEETRRMAEDTIGAFGRIDILVNNAAVFVGIERRPFYEISAEEWDRVSAVNIKGVFLCTKAVFPQMRRQGGGKIINISSTTALQGTPLFLHYVASKAAVIGITRALAREAGPYGIAVNAIAPGLIHHEGMNAPKEFTELQLQGRALKRLEVPEDLLGTVVYLASSDSDFVTGQTIVVDGGSVLY